jgi:CO/xanthine dehydrogenase Mo-binding subunit
VEVGQGLHTVLAQIAAEEFGITLAMIKVLHNDSAVCPFDAGCVSSRSTFFTGNAVRLACQDAKRQLSDIAAVKLGVNAGELDVSDGKIFLREEPDRFMKIGDLFLFQTIPFNRGEIVGTGSCHIAASPEDPETGQSERSVAYFSYFAHAVEVAVNTETGQVKVLKIATVADGGTPVNPKMVEGQIEGGFLQGIGTSLYEHVILDNGAVMNPDFHDYKMPTAQEMPLNKNVKAIIESAPHPEGPYGAKGVGEGPLIAIAPAISNAVYNATGVRIKDLPITGDKVLKGLMANKA